MILKTEQEMLEYGRSLGRNLATPAVFELVGDVGTGKTTITRGLAEALGVAEPVTSPSFTISKQYAAGTKTLIHYDFYRLPDPGLMLEDLAESINNPNAVVVVEWAESVANILPANRHTIYISYNDDGSRTVEENLDQPPYKIA